MAKIKATIWLLVIEELNIPIDKNDALKKLVKDKEISEDDYKKIVGEIGAKGVKFLVDGLKNNSTLTSLNLWGILIKYKNI